MDCSTPGLPVHHQLPELAQTHVHRVCDAIQPSHPLSSSYPPAFNLSSIRVISNESVLHVRWPKNWSFSFNISPSNEHSGLISFRMDWLDLQGTLKSLLQHHSSKASILWCSALFMVQLSHSYTSTGKTITLTRWTFIGKVMSLLFNILFRLVIAFLPRSKCLLILWLQASSAVILEPRKIKSVTVSIVSPSICHDMMGPDAMVLEYWGGWLFPSPRDLSNPGIKPRSPTFQADSLPAELSGNPRDCIGGKHLLLRSINPDSFSLSSTNKGSEWP